MTGNWLPDPTGKHQYRYHDGNDWTKNVSDDGNALIDETFIPGTIAPLGSAPAPVAEPDPEPAPVYEQAQASFDPSPFGDEPVHEGYEAPSEPQAPEGYTAYEPVEDPEPGDLFGPEDDDDEPSGLRKKIALMVAGSLALLLIGGGAFVLLGSGGDDSPADPPVAAAPSDAPVEGEPPAGEEKAAVDIISGKPMAEFAQTDDFTWRQTINANYIDYLTALAEIRPELADGKAFTPVLEQCWAFARNEPGAVLVDMVNKQFASLAKTPLTNTEIRAAFDATIQNTCPQEKVKKASS